MYPNPYDPRERTDLTDGEKTVLAFTGGCIHGQDASLIDKLVADDYTQHTAGIGQGKQGLLTYLQNVAWKRPGIANWRPIHIFHDKDFVILHKLLGMVIVADFFRIDAEGKLAEHWDVVQPHPEPDYDPMKPSTEDLGRFKALFNLPD